MPVWEVLAAAPEAGPSAPSDNIVSIHDPCTARHDTAWQQAVRELARRHVTVHEPHRSGPETPCCGYGGLVWNAQPDLADAMTAHRAADLPHRGLASCIMCRDRLVAQGKACLHVLDILPPTAALAPDPASKGPGLSERRAARATLRHRLRREWLHEESPAPTRGEKDAAVLLAPDLLEQMERRHILLQDVEEAVRGVELTGNCFEDLDSGHRLGSWTPRNVTFWVEYSVTDAGYRVHDAWCHRMRVPEADATACSQASPAKRTES